MDFVWYSNASDETGKALAEDLGYESGRKTPDFSDISALVCWGAKGGTKYDPEKLNGRIKSGDLRILNHPERVDFNKDKLWMMGRLKERDIPVPGFVDLSSMPVDEKRSAIEKGIEAGLIDFPILLMNRNNRGQPAFVYTMNELESSLDRWSAIDPSDRMNLDMARSYTHGVDYRIHVFRDTVIWGQRSQPAADPGASLAKALRKKLLRRAKQKEFKVAASDQDIDFIVQELADDLLLGPHQFQRTVGRGLELVDVATGQLPEKVVSTAIAALDAVELDMGAVNLSWDEGSARVTNVISYPGLSDEQRQAYVSAIQEFVKIEKPQKKATKKQNKDLSSAPPELIAQLTRKIKTLSGKQAAELIADLNTE